MLTIPPNTRISLCASPIDMRKSFNGLVAIIRSELATDPVTGQILRFYLSDADLDENPL
jgi:hypothetical protein